jgi:putative SOS response-associated peptidase YedK
MCGRITQSSPPGQLGLKIVSLVDPLNLPPRYNGASGQEQWVIRQNPKTGERTLDRLWWGLIPHWCKEADGGRKPINAKAETVASLPTFVTPTNVAGVSSLWTTSLNGEQSGD